MQFDQMYQESIANPGAFWAKQAEQFFWKEKVLQIVLRPRHHIVQPAPQCPHLRMLGLHACALH